MKVLITGGMGVIGAETSRKFVREGHRPVIYARHRDDRLIFDILDKVDFESGDVLDWARLLDVIKRHKITHIVHAAGFVGAVSAANPALSIQVNVMGTVNVLEAARSFDIKRVV
jgi:UDP-glucose 4-epimerase